MGFVYAFEDKELGVFKIGSAKTDVNKRLADLTTGRTTPLTVYRVHETALHSEFEATLHRRLQSKRVIGGGREFFKITRAEVDACFDEAEDIAQELFEKKEAIKEFEEPKELTPLIESNQLSISLLNELRSVKAELDSLSTKKSLLELEIKSLIGNSQGIEGVATWGFQTKPSLDSKALKVAYPDIYKEFSRESTSRVFRLK